VTDIGVSRKNKQKWKLPLNIVYSYVHTAVDGLPFAYFCYPDLYDQNYRCAHVYFNKQDQNKLIEFLPYTWWSISMSLITEVLCSPCGSIGVCCWCFNYKYLIFAVRSCTFSSLLQKKFDLAWIAFSEMVSEWNNGWGEGNYPQISVSLCVSLKERLLADEEFLIGIALNLNNPSLPSQSRNEGSGWFNQRGCVSEYNPSLNKQSLMLAASLCNSYGAELIMSTEQY